MQVIYVEQYNLYDFLVAVQQAVINGYRFSDANEHYPSGYSGYRVGMVLQNEGSVEASADAEEGAKPAQIKIKPARAAKQ